MVFFFVPREAALFRRFLCTEMARTMQADDTLPSSWQ
jgi:hypothetical protein